jgi:hypothetical protein
MVDRWDAAVTGDGGDMSRGQFDVGSRRVEGEVGDVDGTARSMLKVEGGDVKLERRREKPICWDAGRERGDGGESLETKTDSGMAELKFWCCSPRRDIGH